MPNPSLKLSASLLLTARGLIAESQDASFFPPLFELEALRSSWAKVVPALTRVDLLSYSPKPAYRLFAPKQKYLIRPVHCLDPIDLLFYTALVLRIARVVEGKRLERDTVFSYRYKRISPTKVAFENDWDGFQQAALNQAATAKFVARTDIVDFFPSTYHHRLENALSALTDDALEVRVIARFLKAWSDQTSYGIPIGPIASNVLAEANLTEVDELLRSAGIRFLRYVDDFYIFGESEQEIISYLHLLAERLFVSQGLSLNLAKTSVVPIAEFLTERTRAPSADEKLRTLIIDKVFHGDPYAEIDYERLSDDQKRLIDQVDMRRQLENALAQELIDITPIKFILMLMTSLRRPTLIRPILDNLGRLGPVSDAVARFFDSFDNLQEPTRSEVGSALISYVRDHPEMQVYQQIWLLQPFVTSTRWNRLDELRSIARSHRNDWVRRQAALALGQSGERSAVLDLRYSIDQTKDWERRAIIYACRSLPKDERGHFFSSLSIGGEWKVNNTLENSVVEYAKKTT